MKLTKPRANARILLTSVALSGFAGLWLGNPLATLRLTRPWRVGAGDCDYSQRDDARNNLGSLLARRLLVARWLVLLAAAPALAGW